MTFSPEIIEINFNMNTPWDEREKDFMGLREWEVRRECRIRQCEEIYRDYWKQMTHRISQGKASNQALLK